MLTKLEIVIAKYNSHVTNKKSNISALTWLMTTKFSK